MPPSKPLPDRLMAKRAIDPETGCWLWQGARDPRGYGRVGVTPTMTRFVHRVAYQLFVGEIPDGLVLDHLCRNPPCFNPEHLDPVTQRENLLRGDTIVAANGAKTECPKGHPYDVENTRVAVVSARGGLGRFCRTCHREKQRIYSRDKRARLRGEAA